MNIEKKQIDDLNIQLTLNIDAEDYAPIKKKKLNERRRTAEFKGFRKGMVPASLIERVYGEQCLGDAVNDIISEQLGKYMEESGLNFIGEPLTSEDQPEIEWKDGNDFVFKFDLAVAPKIDFELSSSDKVVNYTIKSTAIAKEEEEKYKYDGIASKEAMLSFMEKKKNDDVFVIKSLKEIKDYLAKKNLVLMSTLTDKKSDLYDSFLNFARSTINLEFVSCETKECINKYGEDVILFKTFDEKENSYKKEYAIINPEINFNSVYDFVSIFSIEMGGFLAPHGIDALVNYAKQALIYVRNNTGENITTDKYDPLFKQLGKELRFNNTYVYVSDMGQTTGTNIGDAFSILPEELPCIFFYQQNTGDPYTNVKTFSKRNLDMTKENAETIKNFIDDVLKGKILRDLYSEPPSDSGMENGILKVVGKTFDRDVVREKRNVFLAVIEDEDYMEEEQKFLRMLREMAKKNENKNLIFAYINVGRNEPRDLEIWGIPFPFGFLYTNALEKKSIIKFIPKDHKDISEKEVMNFIEKNINVEDRNEDL